LPKHQLDDQKPSHEPPPVRQQIVAPFFTEMTSPMCQTNQPGPKGGHYADEREADTRCGRFEFVDPDSDLRYGRQLDGPPE
jgi:hypothetical protein